MEAFGRCTAANWTRVQTLARLACSRTNGLRSFTAERPMLAAPSRAMRTARSFGLFARRVPPKIRMNSFGLNLRLSQPLTLNGEETPNELKAAGSSGLEPPPSKAPLVAKAEQLVGLSENFGR